jgi:microsomal dipeptidase-like Zn-dependent dipeptidase
MRDWEKLHAEATVFDLHVHPGLKASLFSRDLANSRVPILKMFSKSTWPMTTRSDFPKMEAGGLDAAFETTYATEQGWLDDLPILKWVKWIKPSVWRQFFVPTYFDTTMATMDLVEEQAQSYTNTNFNASHHAYAKYRRPVRFATGVAELKELLDTDAICLVRAIEGAHSLQHEFLGKEPIDDACWTDSSWLQQAENELLANLQAFWDRGVASLTLAHFYPNACVNPVFPYPEHAFKFAKKKRGGVDFLDRWDHNKGLTPLGEIIVEKMLELGMLIDVCHCTPRARARIYEIVDHHGATSRVHCSHTGVRAINNDPYNLSDWEIQWIANHGGVIGIIFMNYWLSPDESNLGMKYILNTLEHLRQIGGDDVIGIGTDFDGFTDPPDELEDMSKLPRLTRMLASEYAGVETTSYPDDVIRKFLGGNALRLLFEGWGRD